MIVSPGHDFLRNRNYYPEPVIKKKIPTLEEVYETQWSSEFEILMRNRLAMGFFRYGPLNNQPAGKYDNIGSIRKRLALYEETGNDEILVDIANVAMVEFLNGNHPNKHFNAEDDGIHTEEKK